MSTDPADVDRQPSPTGITRRALLATGAAAFFLARRNGDGPQSSDGETVTAETTGATVEPASAVTPPADTVVTAVAEGFALSEVAAVGPEEALLFLAGRHPRYPDAGLDSLMGFSAANILETMDTDVLDTVRATRSGMALDRVYRIIAEQVLETVLAVYGESPVVLALDAGHGGRRGVFYDPGANGTEAGHTRAVVELIEEQATAPRYAAITLRRIFNDAIGDDFGLPPPEDRKGAAALTLRNVRAAMLAAEAAAWNQAHPERPVSVHVISVHFNAGSGGILVLHQGTAVAEAFRHRSIDYARAYVAAARPVLNASGLLPYPLRLALGTGLSDDRLLYEPPFRASRINPFTGADRSTFPRRYAMLQASLLQRDYALGALIYHGLVSVTHGRQP